MSGCPGGWSQAILEVLGCCGYTWSAFLRPVGCAAKFSERPLETVYGRKRIIPFTGATALVELLILLYFMCAVFLSHVLFSCAELLILRGFLTEYYFVWYTSTVKHRPNAVTSHGL